MLCLNCKIGRSIVIGTGPNRVTIKFDGVNGYGQAKLVIDAPKAVPIHRAEVQARAEPQPSQDMTEGGHA